ncbi:MAG TPA: enoyl-CoA hydratase/isomerase family protein [Myxococcota bacterium]|nr:enoyl-CoA hydratase/isomerase family protein [Myxococcota bacterium]
MSFETLELTRRDDSIAIVRLNRPQRLNAINGRVLEELDAAVSAIDADPEIRVFLLCGAPRLDGRPCFSAGFDLKSVAEGVPLDPHLGARLTDRIDDLLKPSIAVVDGVCSTGGAELALCCDFRVVGEGLELSDWHLKRLGTGLGGWGGGVRWPRLVGVQNAKEIILTGRVVSADDAVRIGFATARHASADLMGHALAMAGAIAQMNPKGVRMCLAHLDRYADMSRDTALRHAIALPGLFGVQVGIEGKADAVLGKPAPSKAP